VKPGQPYVENDHSGPTIGERVEQAWRKAMAPWEWLNSCSGRGAGKPTRPPGR